MAKNLELKMNQEWEERKSQIIPLYLQGLSLGDIAEETGISTRSVLRVVKEWKQKDCVQTEGVNPKPEERHDQAKKDMDDKATTDPTGQIAEDLDPNLEHVRSEDTT